MSEAKDKKEQRGLENEAPPIKERSLQGGPRTINGLSPMGEDAIKTARIILTRDLLRDREAWSGIKEAASAARTQAEENRALG